MSDFSFPTLAPLHAWVHNAAGTSTVTAVDTDTSTVEVFAIDDSSEARELAQRTTAEITDSGRRLAVEVPDRRLFSFRPARVAVRVTVPTGSEVTTRVASGEATCVGRFARAATYTASGAVSVEEVDGDVTMHTASGKVRLGSGGRVTVHTASGGVEIGRATGDITVHSASAGIGIGIAEASVTIRTASGKVRIGEARRGVISLQAASGDLRVGVRAGVVARLDLRTTSGRVRSELPVDETAPSDGAPLEISARTSSGDVLVTPAAGVRTPADPASA